MQHICGWFLFQTLIAVWFGPMAISIQSLICSLKTMISEGIQKSRSHNFLLKSSLKMLKKVKDWQNSCLRNWIKNWSNRWRAIYLSSGKIECEKNHKILQHWISTSTNMPAIHLYKPSSHFRLAEILSLRRYKLVSPHTKIHGTLYDGGRLPWNEPFDLHFKDLYNSSQTTWDTFFLLISTSEKSLARRKCARITDKEIWKSFAVRKSDKTVTFWRRFAPHRGHHHPPRYLVSDKNLI